MKCTSLLLVLLPFFAACATSHLTTGRMYSLNDGSIIRMELKDYVDGYGTASSKLRTGEVLKGEYIITSFWTTQDLLPPRPMLNDFPITSTPGILPKKNELSWAEVYGYNAKTQAKPVGTGTLVGDQGTILHMVFFSADPVRGIGDGVARNNAGQWYRVYVGDITEQVKVN